MRSGLESRAIFFSRGIKTQVGRGFLGSDNNPPLISVLADFLDALLTTPAWRIIDPLAQWVDFMNDRDMSIHSCNCLELPRVFAAVRTTYSYVGEVSHEFCYDSVVITANHRLEPRLRIRIESRPLIFGEDAPTQGMFEFDREA